MYPHIVDFNNSVTGHRRERTRSAAVCGHDLSQWQAFYRYVERRLAKG